MTLTLPNTKMPDTIGRNYRIMYRPEYHKSKNLHRYAVYKKKKNLYNSEQSMKVSKPQLPITKKKYQTKLISHPTSLKSPILSIQ